jgi:hypothetical protein
MRAAISLGANSRGRRLILIVPIVIAMQQLTLAIPGDDVRPGPQSWWWIALVVALSWAAAVRRRPWAYLALLALCVLALLWVLVNGIESDYPPAAYPYMLLTAVAVGLLLSPSAIDHMRD